MQRYAVFLNPRFSGSPVSNSDLQLSDDYFVYTQSLGGGVTSQYNIRGFLNNPQNQLIIDQFAAYMQSNLNQTELNEIYYDDRKLSIVFNQFYQTSIVNGQPSPTVFIDQQLSNTINIVVQDNHWNWDGTEVVRPEGAPATIINATRNEETRDYLLEYTDEQSYYLPIKLEKNWDKTAIETFKVCNDVIDVQIEPLLAESFVGGIIDANQEFFDTLAAVSPTNPGSSNIVSSILQCFVDTNLETNENVIFNANALGVSFLEGRGQYQEGAGYQIPLTLSQPSTRGIEQVEVQVEYLSADENDVTINDNFLINWAEGEQLKNINISINNDIQIEQGESLRLKLTQLLNVYGGANTTHLVQITDNTILREVGFTGGDFALVQNGRGEFLFQMNAPEGDIVELTVGLNTPSLVGGESIDITFSYLGVINAATENSDFTLISPQRIEFAAGEQFKTVQIQLEQDAIAEYVEAVTVNLSNPVGLVLDGTTTPVRGTISISDSTVFTSNVLFNLQNLYRQKGQITDGAIGTELRELTSNATDEFSNKWIVRLGHPYNEATQDFDQNFATYPDFNFGQETADLVPTRLELTITNNGENSVTVDGVEYGIGDSFTVDITGNGFQFVLPTNAELGTTTVTYGLDTFERPIYLNANYLFDLKYTYPTSESEGQQLGFHKFDLKGANLTPFVLHLGNVNVPSQSNFVLNPYYLQTKYTNMGVTYEDGGLCTDIFEGVEHRHDVKINGLILLDSSSNQTNYFSFEFNLSNELTTVCPITDGFAGESGSWQTIPYELFEVPDIPEDTVDDLQRLPAER